MFFSNKVKMEFYKKTTPNSCFLKNSTIVDNIDNYVITSFFLNNDSVLASKDTYLLCRLFKVLINNNIVFTFN